MKATYTAEVVQTEAWGNGVPFAPRVMYAITETVRLDGVDPFELSPFARPAYWSRSVACAIAAEKARIMPGIITGMLTGRTA